MYQKLPLSRRKLEWKSVLACSETPTVVLTFKKNNNLWWVMEFTCNYETKHHSILYLEEPWFTKAKESINQVKFKSMMIAFSNIQGIQHTDCIPQSQTVNHQVFYKEVLNPVCEQVRRKKIWSVEEWHIDSSPRQCFSTQSPSIKAFLVAKTDYPPQTYSSDLECFYCESFRKLSKNDLQPLAAVENSHGAV